MQRRRLMIPLLVMLLAGDSPSPRSAEEPPTKGVPTAPGIQRERVNLILIDVAVTDRKGRSVDDLRPEEFELRVDGKPYPIESVELQRSDGGATPAAPPPPGSGQAPAPAVPLSMARLQRRFVFFFDGLNSERGLGLPAIQAARGMLRKGLPAGDEVMVAGQGHELKIYQEFTSDPKKMLAALDAVEADPQIRTAGENRVRQNVEQLQEAKDLCTGCDAVEKEEAAQRIGTTFADEDQRRIRRTLVSLEALVSYLHSGSGRKDLFFLTDGFPSDPSAFYGTPDESVRKSAAGARAGTRLDDPEGERLESRLLHITREAAAAQVVIHTLNTQGIPGEISTNLRGLPGRSWHSLIEKEASDTLAALAIGTGGIATHNNGNFQAALERVEDQTRVSYVVAFVPAGKPDGLFHSTKVVVRRKGTQVRAKEGLIWMTDEQIQERELLAAHLSPELFHDFPLALEARSYLQEGGKPAVEMALAVPDQLLLFLPLRGEYVAHLEAGITLRAGDSQIADQFNRGIEVTLGPKDFAARGSLTLVARREIPPGDYEAVAVVRDLGTGNVGALRNAIKVPAMPPGRIAMSSLVLESQESRGRRVDIDPATKEDPRLVVPAVYRIFARGTLVVGTCIVYHPQRASETGEARVKVSGSVQKAGKTVREFPAAEHALPPGPGANAFPLEFPVTLGDLEPGVYALEIEALDEVGRHAITQKVEFMVR